MAKSEGVGAEYGSNKHPGIFTGENRQVTHVDITSIPPNEPRPEDVAPTRFALGQSTGYIAPA